MASPPWGGHVAQLRVGLAGAGGVGARHAATIGTLEDVRLVGVTDVDADRARALAAQHGAQVFPDLAALLTSGRLDAIWLCVPPFAHGEPERAVLEAGLPFFVEKPLAADLATAARIAESVADKEILTATGYHWRAMPGVERAVEILADHPVRLAHASWWDKVPPVSWWLRRDGSGGQIVEQATHLVDLLRLLVGEPVWVAAHASADPDRDLSLVDPATAAMLRFDTGAFATLSSTCLLRRKQAASLALIGDGVFVEVREADTLISLGDTVEVVADGGMSKERVDAEFCAAVRSGDPESVRVPYAEALRTHRVGDALDRSVRTGAPVELGARVDG
jgi:myo-inositol 2-dehydrogenase / D-chiro-inositol 1-dehydrogenase